MAANGQAHQIGPHHKLFLERRHQLPGALSREEQDNKVSFSLINLRSEAFDPGYLNVKECIYCIV